MVVAELSCFLFKCLSGLIVENVGFYGMGVLENPPICNRLIWKPFLISVASAMMRFEQPMFYFARKEPGNYADQCRPVALSRALFIFLISTRMPNNLTQLERTRSKGKL